MKLILNLLFALCLFSMTSMAGAEQTPAMSSAQMKQWLQEALHYGFDMKTTDYTKYMSTDYIEHIDGKTFNFAQWLHHMESLKNMMQSYQLRFNEMVAEGNNIAASYDVLATKKTGEKLDIRIIAVFKIKDGKMIYCDELTHLMNGPEADKNLSDKE